MIETVPVINPARFSEVVGHVPIHTEADVDRKLDAASAAFKTWSLTPPEERAARLREAARALRNDLPALTTTFVRENGKPLREAEIDIRRSIELAELVATDLPGWLKPELIERRQHVWARKRPRGVAAVVSPWNSPVLLSFKRVIPAIATGNTVVVKAATTCPLTLSRTVDILNTCFPPGVVSLVTGPGSTVGEKLVTDERVRTVAFTGGTETGRRVMELASRHVKKVFLELGGNDPALVLEDAILDNEAITRMTNAVLRAAGQVCIAIKRIYVHESRMDELVEKLGQSFERVVVGDGLLTETTMGPLNNKPQFDFVARLIDSSKTAGLTVLTRGQKLMPETWNLGFFILPSIVLGAKESDEIVRSEQFGPVVPVMPFKDDEEAVHRANSTEFGLRASVWTSSSARAQKLADRLEAGAVFHNYHGIFRDLHIDFPGVKQSGFSRESRWAALDHYADIYGFAE